MTDFKMEKGADGVAIITWDVPGKSMNVMNQQGFIDLEALIDDALADDAVKGVILTSGKDGSFAGGMDLNIIAKMRDDAGDEPAKGLFDGLMNVAGAGGFGCGALWLRCRVRFLGSLAGLSHHTRIATGQPRR